MQFATWFARSRSIWVGRGGCQTKGGALLLDSRPSSLWGPAMTACCERWRRCPGALSPLLRPPRCRRQEWCHQLVALSALSTRMHIRPMSASKAFRRQVGRLVVCRQEHKAAAGQLSTSTRCHTQEGRWHACRGARRRRQAQHSAAKSREREDAHVAALAVAAVGGAVASGAVLRPLLLCLLIQLLPVERRSG